MTFFDLDEPHNLAFSSMDVGRMQPTRRDVNKVPLTYAEAAFMKRGSGDADSFQLDGFNSDMFQGPTMQNSGFDEFTSQFLMDEPNKTDFSNGFKTSDASHGYSYADIVMKHCTNKSNVIYSFEQFEQAEMEVPLFWPALAEFEMQMAGYLIETYDYVRNRRFIEDQINNRWDIVEGLERILAGENAQDQIEADKNWRLSILRITQSRGMQRKAAQRDKNVWTLPKRDMHEGSHYPALVEELAKLRRMR